MSEKLAILCVDDEPINVSMLKIFFSKKYEVYTAGSGAEGLSILKEHPDIAIILSDMKMPGMNGVEFITKAKSEYPAVICFILTGFEITEEIMKALDEVLIHKYFRKPYNMREIEEAITTLVG